MPSSQLLGICSKIGSQSWEVSFRVLKRCFHNSLQLSSGKRKDRSALPFQSELKNPVNVVFGGVENWPKDEFGKIFDKKPFQVSVKKYHEYKWCGCGWSHSQPFCDTSCQQPVNKPVISGGGPLTYIAPEDKDVWFCNCKQTKHRPFCDGTHRNEEIQQEQLDGKFDLWEPSSKT